MEIQKMVLKLYVHTDKDKQKAMTAVSGLSGVASLAMDMKTKKLTVTGTVDSVVLVNKLRKICQTDVLTVGPAKEPEKKPDPNVCAEELTKAYYRYYCNYCAGGNPNCFYCLFKC